MRRARGIVGPGLLSTLIALLMPWCAHAGCHLANVAAWPLESDLNQPVTRGSIDGNPVRVLIDTGSSMSFIWRSSAERLGLRLVGVSRTRLFGLGGESRVDATFIDELTVQSFHAQHLRLAVAGDQPSPLDVILGEDVLGGRSIEFDIGHGIVRMMDVAGCTPAELPYWSRTYSVADLIASPRAASAIRINVLINGHPVQAQLDSGASVSLLAKSMADAVGVQYKTNRAQLTGIGARSLPTWIADVKSVEIGDERIEHTQLRVAELAKFQTLSRIGSRIPVPMDTKSEMLLGMDFLRSHRVLIDNTKRKVVFTYEGGAVFQTGAPAAATAPSLAEGAPAAHRNPD